MFGTIPEPSLIVINRSTSIWPSFSSRPPGPNHTDIRVPCCPQSEVQPGIVAGEIARLAQHLLHLDLSRVTNGDPRSDRAAVCCCADNLNLDQWFPGGASLRSKEGVSFTFITRMSRSPSLSKSPRADTTTCMCLANCRADFGGQFFEGAVAAISEEDARAPKRILRILLFQSQDRHCR